MIEKFDMLILEFIQQNFQNPFLDFIMNLLSFLGEMAVVWFFIMILYVAINKKKYFIFVLALALLMNHFICSGIFKNLIRRIRPFINDSTLISHAWILPASYSFPSGHASSSFCAATILSKCLPNKKVVWYLLAGGIAVSRIYLNVHYPSDILLGALFGTLIGNAVWICMNRYFLKDQIKSKQ